MGNICIYIIVLVVFLFILFLIYMYYFRAHGLKKGKKHRCNYCGQQTNVVSDCCHAPVKEHFLLSVCTNCGKDCKMLCVQCNRNIAGQ